MANTDNPHGLQPLGRTALGGEGVLDEFDKDVGEATAIFRHDVVSQEADGSFVAGGTPGTTRFHGVSLNHGAALKATTHLVLISPFQLYSAQDNAAVDGFALADRGLNANFEFNAGDATTKKSGHEINETGAAVTGTLDCKLIRLLKAQGNAYGANGDWEITINKHFFAEGAGV